ncbi:hypothetical protein NECAME_04339 [Necator americanus]|uniref:Uncharacterized protein n=1 Tax=Necator americanus TaxID=51031 RepID=W2SWZ4_NECAM|nr:hypothetical protein NECAME_04339 [Necator americanus]ETN73341.1 hypothetical protein NECAME_04339 [Necator americanus]
MRGSEAARSVANYILFDDNPLMQRNKYFYKKQYNNKELFVPDKACVPPCSFSLVMFCVHEITNWQHSDILAIIYRKLL